MSRVEVTIYEKLESHCPACVFMRKIFLKWVDANPQVDVEAVPPGAEPHRDALIELDVSQAPVYVVKRGGEETVISGRNPDILIDALNGVDGIWDF